MAGEVIGGAEVIDLGDGLQVGYEVYARGGEGTEDGEHATTGFISGVKALDAFLAEGWTLDGDLKEVGDAVAILAAPDDVEEAANP